MNSDALQQGQSRSEHSQAGLDSTRPLEGGERGEEADPGAETQPASERPVPKHLQSIHNRDPHAPHTASRGSGSEADENQAA